MRKSIMRRVLLPGLMLTALSVACGGGSNPPVAPGIQPEIVNTADNFQFQVTAVENYSGTLSYVWVNTGPAADVNQSCAVGSRTVTLTLLDENGQTVYTRDLSENGSFVSDAGTSGTWRVRITMSQMPGDLNFRVDKRTP